MEIIRRRDKVRDAVREARRQGRTVGFVPTMGFLHRGHLSLVERSRQETDYQVMSIFVNRIQFNDPRDFDTYPRDLERDFERARNAGVDLMFIPDDAEMYTDALTTVTMKRFTDGLCGASRPGHFDGVFTVVAKLFNIVQPDVAVFGQKDIQQARSIQKMVFDLDFPVRIIIAPIIREPDGIAMSSRNKHLSDDERRRALALSRSLTEVCSLIGGGERDAGPVLRRVREIVEGGRPEKIDYIACVGYDDLQPRDRMEDRRIIALAAFFGTTRLIDNVIIDLRERETECD